eukprot:4545942-Amphidinium_carterae.1
MPCGQRSTKLSGWARSLGSKRSGRERSKSTPGPRIPARTCCSGRTIRQTVLFSALGWGRGLRQSSRPASCDSWNSVTFRFGEASHPGPCQRVVTVNPRGWSRMAPLLAKMEEE